MAYQEEAVAHIDDLKDGEMKQVSIGETDILLAKVNGNFYALHGHCTHYGAPLAEGALCGTRITCPWHHACFDVTTGRHLDPPGMDGLPVYKLYIYNDQVYIKIPEVAPEKETPVLGKQQRGDQVLAMVGGGTAAAYAVQALREEGYGGRIVMITREEDLPYDRVNCSKEYLQDEAPDEWMPLRGQDFYDQHDIEILKNKIVTRLDTRNKIIVFQDGDTLKYEKVLVCTGGEVRTLQVPGAELEHVFTLRSIKDSRTIRDQAKNVQRVVIVGSSFIGMESAWSLQKLGCEVTVVSPDVVPFGKVWGDRVGSMIRKMHEKNGVKFRLAQKVAKIEGSGKVERVVLENGEVIETDMVLVGIGVRPATDFVEGLDLAEDGGVRVDPYFHAGNDTYAAGDIAQFTYDGNPVRIEHWRVACQQGRLAGQNMAGKETPYQSVPFFWTAQQGANIRYVGYVKSFDRILYEGNVEDQDFIAFYVKNGQIKAALGMNRDQEMAAVEALFFNKHMPGPEEVASGKVDWLNKLKE